jgi:hypothetical protein
MSPLVLLFETIDLQRKVRVTEIAWPLAAFFGRWVVYCHNSRKHVGHLQHRHLRRDLW